MRRVMSWNKTTGLLCFIALTLFIIYLYNQSHEVSRSQIDSDTRITRLEADLARLHDELRKGGEDELVVIYNRVPKTGSTSFAGIAYDLCTRNRFHVIHVNSSKNSHVMSLPDQNQSHPLGGTSDWGVILSQRGVTRDGDELVARTDTDIVMIYNRVPKTGSTTFANVMYSLCSANEYNVIYVRAEKNSHIYSVADQMRFVTNVTNWHEKKPAMYHGHLAFLDFNRFGATQQPIYINLLREPLDRLISYYYFLRHGDNFRPHLKRRKSHNKETFDECVMKKGHDCNPDNLWMQIPFFCGHAAECWLPGSTWALEMAKHNLVNHYLVVGVTEDMGDFVAVLEATLPRFFRGATQLYNTGAKSHLRKTSNKTPPSDDTMSKMKESEVYRMELDFYLFAKEQFDYIKHRTFELRDGYLEERKQQFMFEKVRPS